MKRASIWRRLVGLAIDFSIIFVLGCIVGLTFNLLTQLEPTSAKLIIFGVAAGTTGLILLLTRDYLLGPKSPGHYLTGTAVVTTAGDSPSKTQLTFRNLPLLFWPIEALGIIYYGFKKRFGDTWSGTKVVLAKSTAKGGHPIIRWILAVVVLSGGFFVSFKVIQFNLSTLPPYKVAVEKIQTNPEVKSAVGEIKSIGRFPQGNVNITPEFGSAYFSIKVIGEKDTKWANIQLINQEKQIWKVKKLQISSD